MINIFSSSRYKVNKKNLKKEVEKIATAMGVNSSYTINVIFVGKTKMRKLSNTYKKENEALPVLSFSYQDQPIDSELLLGEVFLCYPQVVLLAAERNRKVEETIISLIRHGVDNLLK